MYYVYLLRSLKDKEFYIGYSSDLKNRLLKHQAGGVETTKDRLPVCLVYYEAYLDQKQARVRELKLKQFGSAYTGLLKRLGYK